MAKFRDLSIKWKIGLGFGILILLILAGGMYNLNSLNRLKTSQREISTSMKTLNLVVKNKENIWKAQLLAQKWLTPVVEENRTLLSYILANENDEAELKSLYTALADLNKKIISAGEELLSVVTSDQVISKIKSIQASQEE
ncbi:MAG: hypothetical protein ACE5FU_07110, partial [Nitrospinota bacterium]